MNNIEYHNENKQAILKRVIKSTASNSSEFGSTVKKRSNSKSTSRSKRKENIRLEAKQNVANIAAGYQIKNNQLMNRSLSSRNIIPIHPTHEVTSKVDKSFNRVISKYPNTANKQIDKIKDLK